MAINVNGDEIGTLVNVNEKNPEDDDQIPRRGMAFSSELEAEEFCKKYAKRIGFTVRKGKVQRKANGTLKGRCFLCSCEGFRTKKHPNQGTKYQRSETRTGCNVQIQVKLDNGQWVITKLHLEHNHRLQCLDTLNWPSDEVEGASGADKEIQTSFAPTEAEDTDKTLTDPNTAAAGLLEMVEGSGVTSNTRESIWQQIWTKYGDVTANCSFTAPQFVEIIKGSILQIVELMQKNTACSLSGADTYFIDRALSDLERVLESQSS
ncbi:uncharacterized protein LOC100241462 [Vitis vinifera]|nr:uncharacterized protein LOC100241462 [Vitis vinifera]|eukprot:XP_002276877.1 PREDICTED: uncharacterized protein LOC100241462 [Vitis vinifera]